jgi:hypothetical protein
MLVAKGARRSTQDEEQSISDIKCLESVGARKKPAHSKVHKLLFLIRKLASTERLIRTASGLF